MSTTIETEIYLNSLSDDTLFIDISCEGIKSLPDLSRFKTLKKLECSNNQLTSLDNLPPTLTYLDCSYNNITNLDNLTPTLTKLICYNNELKKLVSITSVISHYKKEFLV